MISRKHTWFLGKARSPRDLASLVLLAIVIAGILMPVGVPLLAFFSSPVPTEAGRSPVEAGPTTSVPTRATAEVTGASSGWQRPVGMAVIVLGIVLVLGGVVYLVRYRKNAESSCR